MVLGLGGTVQLFPFLGSLHNIFWNHERPTERKRPSGQIQLESCVLSMCYKTRHFESGQKFRPETSVTKIQDRKENTKRHYESVTREIQVKATVEYHSTQMNTAARQRREDIARCCSHEGPIWPHHRDGVMFAGSRGWEME